MAKSRKTIFTQDNCKPNLYYTLIELFSNCTVEHFLAKNYRVYMYTYHITDILCSRIKEIEKMFLKPTICDTYDIKCSLYLRINFTIKMHFSFALVVNKE